MATIAATTNDILSITGQVDNTYTIAGTEAWYDFKIQLTAASGNLTLFFNEDTAQGIALAASESWQGKIKMSQFTIDSTEAVNMAGWAIWVLQP